jgi:hypothetical protein
MGSELSPGWRWYSDARAVVQGLADIHAIPASRVAGMIAALSPRCVWRTSVRQAITMLEGGTLKGNVLPLNKQRAQAIHAGGEPLSILHGPKTRAFYRALMGDDRACVVDTWMLRAFKSKNDKPTPKQYNRYAWRIRRAAAEKRMPAVVWQAEVWCAVREGKSHVYIEEEARAHAARRAH